MNNKLNFDQSTFKILYLKYKELIIPCVVIVVSIIIFLEVILPQVKELVSIREEEKNAKARVESLKKNLLFLSNIDNSNLDIQLKLTTSALPGEKDFAGIINAISNTAVNTGVALDDFGFQVGELSTKSAKMTVKPSIEVGLSVKTDIEGLKRFLDRLYEEFPIAQVTGVNIEKKAYGVGTAFFYKPLAQIKFDESKELKSFSKDEQNLLNNLLSWNKKNTKGADFLSEISSSSGLESFGSESAKTGPF